MCTSRLTTKAEGTVTNSQGESRDGCCVCIFFFFFFFFFFFWGGGGGGDPEITPGQELCNVELARNKGKDKDRDNVRERGGWGWIARVRAQLPVASLIILHNTKCVHGTMIFTLPTPP